MAPPLVRQDSTISIEKYAKNAKNAAWPPLFVTWAEALIHKGYVLYVCFRPAPNFGQIMGLNLSENLSFCCSSPNFGQKLGLNLSKDLPFIFLLFA